MHLVLSTKIMLSRCSLTYNADLSSFPDKYDRTADATHHAMHFFSTRALKALRPRSVRGREVVWSIWCWKFLFRGVSSSALRRAKNFYLPRSRHPFIRINKTRRYKMVCSKRRKKFTLCSPTSTFQAQTCLGMPLPLLLFLLTVWQFKSFPAIYYCSFLLTGKLRHCLGLPRGNHFRKSWYCSKQFYLAQIAWTCQQRCD